MNSQTRISDLTVEELSKLIRAVVREELRQPHVAVPRHQTALLELEPLKVGGWPEGLNLLSREEYYGDER